MPVAVAPIAKARKHRSKSKSGLPIMLVAIGVLILYCTFQTFPGSYADFQFDQGKSGVSQSQFISLFMQSKAQDAVLDKEYKQYLHNDEWEVVGTGDEYLDQLLTVFNMIAYHYDEIVAEITSKDSSAKPLSIPTDVDLEVYATSIIGTSLFESSSADMVESWGVTQDVWKTLTDDEKIAALLNDNWAHDVNKAAGKSQGNDNYVDSSGYARYANGKIAGTTRINSNGDRVADHGGYNRGNVVTGKDVNGDTVTIGGRWGYGLYQWTYGRRRNMGVAWQSLPYDLSTMQGQVIWSIAEGMNAFGGGMYNSQQAVINECTATNFPQGLHSNNIEQSVALFWRNCVYGTNTLTLQEANNSSERRARNEGIVGGAVHGSPKTFQGHTVLECLIAYSEGGTDSVKSLLNS